MTLPAFPSPGLKPGEQRHAQFPFCALTLESIDNLSPFLQYQKTVERETEWINERRKTWAALIRLIYATAKTPKNAKQEKIIAAG